MLTPEMKRNRRMSLGGGALRESSYNSRRMSVAPMPSAAGTNSNRRAATPRDRQAQLEEYRNNKRAPSSDFDRQLEMSGNATLHRMRMFKQQKLLTGSDQHHHRPPSALSKQVNQYLQLSTSLDDDSFNGVGDENNNNNYSAMSHHSNRHDDASFLLTTIEKPAASASLRSSTTPGYQQHHQQPPRSFSQESSYLPFSQESEIPFSQLSQGTTTAAAVTSSSSSSFNVENVARYEEMKKRLQQLEEEKMEMQMAMAPMQNRHRAQETAWVKEQTRLLQEIDAHQHSAEQAEKRYRDLEAKYDETMQENRQLRAELRKKTTTINTTTTATTSAAATTAVADSAAWHVQSADATGRQHEVTELQQQLAAANAEIHANRLTRVSLETELHSTKIQLDSTIRAYEKLQDEYDNVAEVTSEDREAKIKLEALTTEHIATSAQLNAVCSDLAATKARMMAELDAKKGEFDAMVEKYQFELSVLKTRAAEQQRIESRSNNNMDCDNDEEDFAVLKARIEERDRKIAEFEKERLMWETVRRQMHNRIQELRGNVRVFVRTRPFLPSDGTNNNAKSAIDVSPDGENMTILDGRTNAQFDFKFDKVFAQSSGQDAVFDEVSDFVQSALDGYNVCLFSYGQTGSGKTHTMQGSGNGAMRGIIPRAVEQILLQAHQMRLHGWTFTVSASFLEIYNENLRDLLVGLTSSSASSANNTSAAPKLAIKRSREGTSYVENLSKISIDATDTAQGLAELDVVMNAAARSRSVACTKMNAQSSRSHSVFMLQLDGVNQDSGAVVHGALNLCDLAGSERLDRSGAGADAARLRETQAINKSLSCLGDVFTSLSNKSSHVPYRNSKLTYLLQDCLSGDGKALMFVNLSPTTMSSSESLCSLRFAQRVNQVELGKATKHVQYNR